MTSRVHITKSFPTLFWAVSLPIRLVLCLTRYLFWALCLSTCLVLCQHATCLGLSSCQSVWCDVTCDCKPIQQTSRAGRQNANNKVGHVFIVHISLFNEGVLHRVVGIMRTSIPHCMGRQAALTDRTNNENLSHLLADTCLVNLFGFTSTCYMF